MTVRAAYGCVSAIKAQPSREITVILAEFPEEHHVSLTTLLYGKPALMTVAKMPAGTPYGLLDSATSEQPSGADEAGGEAPGADAEVQVILGHVSSVRPVPSRAVSVVTLEIPEKFHVAATSLAYAKPILLLPSNLPAHTPHGVHGASGLATANEQARGIDQQQPQEPQRMRGLTPAQPVQQLDVTKWLGTQCNSPRFQAWLQALDADHAADICRQRCRVSSRADIQRDPEALERFMTQVYSPFKAHERRTAASAQSAPMTCSQSPFSRPRGG